MTDDGYFFLTRLRKNAVIREVYDFKLLAESAVLSDQMVLIGTPQSRAENYFRLLKVMDSKGNILHLSAKKYQRCINLDGPLSYFSNGLNNISTSRNSTAKANGPYKIKCFYCTDSLLSTCTYTD